MNVKVGFNIDRDGIMPYFGELLPQKYLTYSLLNFLRDSGLINYFSAAREFTFDSAAEMLRQNIGLDTSDSQRTRMVQVMIDFLCECGVLENQDRSYTWRNIDYGVYGLSGEEIEIVRTSFGGQISFFDRCIQYSETFLRGGAPLFKFDGKSLHDWESFLGNPEYELARRLLARLLSLQRGGRYTLLNLCSGTGFDIRVIQDVMPDAEITAIDYTDIFHERAYQKVQNPDSISWTDSNLWDGFGHPLPFNDQEFDLVFFSCADPYIPSDARHFVYSDIYRVLKSGGSLGILTNSYPDPGRRLVRDPWIRRGVLSHDFAESVCEGWHGFSQSGDSCLLFQEIGFSVSSVLLNESLWRLDKE